MECERDTPRNAEKVLGGQRQAAARYGLSDRTLRRYLAEGRISAHRIGPRVLRFDPAELEAQLTGACVNCSGATANIEEDT